MCFSSVSPALGYIQNGTLRALGVAALERTALLPDVPTIAELGFPGFEANAWHGLVAPAGNAEGRDRDPASGDGGDIERCRHAQGAHHLRRRCHRRHAGGAVRLHQVGDPKWAEIIKAPAPPSTDAARQSQSRGRRTSSKGGHCHEHPCQAGGELRRHLRCRAAGARRPCSGLSSVRALRLGRRDLQPLRHAGAGRGRQVPHEAPRVAVDRGDGLQPRQGRHERRPRRGGRASTARASPCTGACSRPGPT